MEETLAAFITTLEEELQSATHSERFSVLPERLADLARKVWPDIAVRFEVVRRWLEDMSPATEEALERVGLTGGQLELKLAGYFVALGRVRRVINRNAYARQLKRLLGWANIILGSLTEVFPPAEILKEFKEVVEHGVEFSGAAGGRH